jgi:hypothetical protein
VGSLLGAISSLPIALSSFSPSWIEAEPIYSGYYSYPLVSSDSALPVILGSAIMVGIFTTAACAGAACLNKFTSPDRHATAKQMFIAASYVALLYSILIALLSGVVFGVVAAAIYEGAGLWAWFGLLDGVGLGLFYGFLIGLAPSLWYKAIFAHRALIGQPGNPVKYLESLRAQGLVRRAGCNFKLADHWLVSNVTLDEEATRNSQATE